MSIKPGETDLIHLTLLAAVQPTVPPTPAWTPTIGLVMIICNLLAIAIGRYAIQKPGRGPDFPVDKPALFRQFNIPELLATMSFGHIIGTGVILGLTNSGLL